MLSVNMSITEQHWQRVVDETFDDMLDATFNAFDAGVRASEIVDRKVTLDWDFPAALFFSATVLTSIGYGFVLSGEHGHTMIRIYCRHLVPRTLFGKLFCMAYALFGIPLTLISIADLAKFLSNIIYDLYSRTKGRISTMIRQRKWQRQPEQHRLVDDTRSFDYLLYIIVYLFCS